MTININALFAGAAFAFSVGANAQIGGMAENGELVLSAWDPVQQVSYSRGLGIYLNDFMPTGVARDYWGIGGLINQSPQGLPDGTMSDEGGEFVNFGADTLFASTFANSLAQNISWQVVATDATGGNAGVGFYDFRGAYTTNQLNGFLNATAVFASAQQNISFNQNLNAIGCDVSTSCAMYNNVDFQYAGNPSNSGMNYLPIGVSANINSDLGMVYAFAGVSTPSVGSGSTPAAVTAYANSANNAYWSLDLTGNLTYQLAAVPVPPALILLGSALIGLAGIARRRAA